MEKRKEWIRLVNQPTEEKSQVLAGDVIVAGNDTVYHAENHDFYKKQVVYSLANKVTKLSIANSEL